MSSSAKLFHFCQESLKSLCWKLIWPGFICFLEVCSLHRHWSLFDTHVKATTNFLFFSKEHCHRNDCFSQKKGPTLNNINVRKSVMFSRCYACIFCMLVNLWKCSESPSLRTCYWKCNSAVPGGKSDNGLICYASNSTDKHKAQHSQLLFQKISGFRLKESRPKWNPPWGTLLSFSMI